MITVMRVKAISSMSCSRLYQQQPFTDDGTTIANYLDKSLKIFVFSSLSRRVPIQCNLLRGTSFRGVFTSSAIEQRFCKNYDIDIYFYLFICKRDTIF